MGLIDRIVGVESGGDPNATNPNSSATGLGQFISSTWIDTLSKHRPDLVEGKSPEEILALRTNPEISRAMTEAYASDNGAILSKAGHPVTPANTYLAHFAGPGGAVKVLSSDPSAPVSSILGDAAVKANPFLRNMTAADLQAWAGRKMGGAQPAGMPPSAPPILAQSQPAAQPVQQAAQQPAQPIAPQAAPIFAAAPQASAGGGGGAAMPEQMQAPPIFASPRKPIDLSRLQAALQARQSGGFFNGRG